jgi:hypothetical protein
MGIPISKMGAVAVAAIVAMIVIVATIATVTTANLTAVVAAVTDGEKAQEPQVTSLRKLLRPFDFFVFIFAIGVVGASFLIANPSPGQNKKVVISSGKELWVYTLQTEASVTIHGPLGDTIVEIKNGIVSIKESACTSKSCTFEAPIKDPGQWIACLPNQVLVRIEFTDDSEDVDVSSW